METLSLYRCDCFGVQDFAISKVSHRIDPYTGDELWISRSSFRLPAALLVGDQRNHR